LTKVNNSGILIFMKQGRELRFNSIKSSIPEQVIRKIIIHLWIKKILVISTTF